MTADLNNVTDAQVEAQIKQIDEQVAMAGPEDSSAADNSSDLATAITEGSGIKDITEIVRAVGAAFGAKNNNIFQAAPSEEEEERQKNKKAKVKKPSLPMPGERRKSDYKNGESLERKMGGKDAEFASMFKITRSSVGSKQSKFTGLAISANDDMVSPQKRREMTAMRATLKQRLEDGFHIPQGAHRLTEAQMKQMNMGDMRVQNQVADYGSLELKGNIARTTGNDQIMKGPTIGKPRDA